MSTPISLLEAEYAHIVVSASKKRSFAERLEHEAREINGAALAQEERALELALTIQHLKEQMNA